MRRAQRISFNTLDNWGHKTPTQSKKRKDRKERLKGHSLKHIQYTWLHNYNKGNHCCKCNKLTKVHNVYMFCSFFFLSYKLSIKRQQQTVQFIYSPML